MKKYSTYALLICIATYLFFGLSYYPKWQKSQAEASISWDVAGYYTYMPALFIYKDLQQCAFRKNVNATYQFSPDDAHLVPQPNGNVIIKYPIGQAILMLPFFTVAHFITTTFTKLPADGYSYYYQLCLGIGFLCYSILGLVLCRKLLLHYFTDATTAITLICIGIGSNLLNYGAIDQLMTHAPLFMLYAALLLQIIKFYKQANSKTAIAIGLLFGLMVIVRPTEIIAVILIALWGVSTIADAKNRFHFLIANYKKYIAMCIAFGVVIGIQLFYWKTLSGHCIIYSYTSQGFNFLQPYWRGFLFSTRCGWLRYCPIMVLTIIGFWVVLFQQKNRWAVLLFSAVNVYILCSWDIWWYGGRAMVQSYVVMAFALASLIQFCNQHNWLKVILYPCLIAGIYINIWWTINAHGGKILVADVTKAYWLQTYGRWTTNESITKLLDNPDWCKTSPKNIDTMVNKNLFANDTSQQILQVNKDVQYSPLYPMPTNYNNHKWLRVFAQCTTTQKEWDQWKMCQLTYTITTTDSVVKSNMIRVHRLLADNETKEISFDILLPTQPIVSSSFQVWNAGGDKQVQVSHIRVIAFDE
jgi:hypothetical protein